MRNMQLLREKTESIRLALQSWAKKNMILEAGESLELDIRLVSKPTVTVFIQENFKPLPACDQPEKLRVSDLPWSKRTRKGLQWYFSKLPHPTLADVSKITFKEINYIPKFGTVSQVEVVRVLQHYRIPTAIVFTRSKLKQIEKTQASRRST